MGPRLPIERLAKSLVSLGVHIKHYSRDMKVREGTFKNLLNGDYTQKVARESNHSCLDPIYM